MASQYRVTSVRDSHPWDSEHGKMTGWTLSVDNLTEGTSGLADINTKVPNVYKEGDEFWAETKGERAGVLKLKKCQAPFGGPQGAPPAQRQAQPSQAAQNAPQVIPQAPAVAKPKPMSTDDAMKLIGHLGNAGAWDTTLVGFVFYAILDGRVENPLKPKVIVRYFGKDIETAGVEQAAWDEIDGLCNDLTELTDQKHVRALLIATCQVASRKDLTADKAKLYAAALRADIQVVKSQRAVEPEPPVAWDEQF